MKILCLIPARRDSKGIPEKNWKPLLGVPLINYSIESALKIHDIHTLCISTNSDEIIEIVQKNFDLKVHFKRPESLSTDYSSSRDVILHAVDYFEKNNEYFDAILLLQPTSPLRKTIDIQNCISLFQENECEMVVSVCQSPYNPYYNIYIENNDSKFIQKSIQGSYTRRQDCPPAYLINGSIYVISVKAIKENEIHNMSKLLKYVMPWEFNIDLDKPEDWIEMENLIKRESNVN